MDASPLFTPATPPAGPVDGPRKWIPTPATVAHVAPRPAALPWLCALTVALFVPVLFGKTLLLWPAALALASTVLMARRWRVAVVAAERRNAEARMAPGRHARADESDAEPSDPLGDAHDPAADDPAIDNPADHQAASAWSRDAERPTDGTLPSPRTAKVPGQRGGPPSGSEMVGRHRAPSG